jgi:hypothetical protein
MRIERVEDLLRVATRRNKICFAQDRELLTERGHHDPGCAGDFTDGPLSKLKLVQDRDAYWMAENAEEFCDLVGFFEDRSHGPTSSISL